VNVLVFFSRAPGAALRLGNPSYKKVSFSSLLVSVLVAQAISAAADGVTYKVRHENGVDQYYLLEVAPSITPIKLNPSERNQPQYATGGLPVESLTAFAVSTTFVSSSRGVLST
jgi:hypothetical protein